jgi:hypothetical protein
LQRIEALSSKVSYPRSLMTPVIDGYRGSYFDWFGAGSIQVKDLFSSMHAVDSTLFTSIHFCFDLESFFLRLEPSVSLHDQDLYKSRIRLLFIHNENEMSFDFHFSASGVQITSFPDERQNISSEYPKSDICTVHFNDIFECAIPFTHIIPYSDSRMESSVCQFHIELYFNDHLKARYPFSEGVSIHVPPDPSYNDVMWSV